jgi:hypothetical protein
MTSNHTNPQIDSLHDAAGLRVFAQRMKLTKDTDTLYRGKCPFHSDKLSFKVSLDSGLWRFECSLCNATGDAAEFVSRFDQRLNQAADNLFIPIPGRIFNDFETGKMTLNMWGIYSVILRQLNFDTGIWRGTAYKICAAWGDRIPLRTIQENLRNLCDAGYVKSFHVQGQRGGYVIAVEGYRIRFGPKEGHILNAMATTDPNYPVYEYAPVRTRKEKTGVKPRSVRRQRGITAASVRRQRGISAPSPAANARIPDVPEILDVKDGQDSQTIHPSRAQSAEPKTGGWLVGRVCSLLEEQTGSPSVPNDEELHTLRSLATKHGDLAILLSFAYFLDRNKTLAGVAWPLKLFFKEFDAWLRHAVREAENQPFKEGIEYVWNIKPDALADYSREDLYPICYLAEAGPDADYRRVDEYVAHHEPAQIAADLEKFNAIRDAVVSGTKEAA